MSADPKKAGGSTSSAEADGDLCPGDVASSSSRPEYGRILQQQRRITRNVNDRSSHMSRILTNSGRAGPVRFMTGHDRDNFFYAGEAVGRKVNIGRVSGKPTRGRLLEASLRFCPAYGYQYTLNILLSAMLLDGSRQYNVHKKLERFRLVPSFHVGYQGPISILLPVSMAGRRFQDFLAMYENAVLQQHLLEARLVVMLLATEISTVQSVSAAIDAMKQRYSWADIVVHVRSEAFSRAKALHYAASLQGEGDLMFFCDVDITFSLSVLQRCKANTIPRQQVYSPIPFALYEPQFVRHARKSRLSSISTSSYNASASAEFYQIIDDMVQHGWPPHKNPTSSEQSPAMEQQHIVETGAMVDSEHGRWLEHSYGMLCIHRQDYMQAGGFNLSITGWGGEDVDLADRLALSGLDLFRSPDPELVHRWHAKHCHAGTLSDHQMIMCAASQAESIASQQVLTLVHGGM